MSLKSNPLSGYQIIDVFNAVNTLKEYNCQVIPIDYFLNFKLILPKNNFCICYNTLSAHSIGTGHWCLLLLRNNNLYHVDSLNNSIDNRVLDFCENICSRKKIRFSKNNIKLQTTYSNICGHVCIYSAYYLSCGNDLGEILKRFAFLSFDEVEHVIVNFVKHKYNIW